MVSIKRKKIGGQEYYYLGHTMRKKGKIEYKERYLGKILPKNVEELKRDFLKELYEGKWETVINRIKAAYLKEKKSMPESAINKELETFMIKFTYDTQKIEGSKLTLRDSYNLLEKGITPKGKPIDDVKEAESHKEVFFDMLKYKKDISMQIILKWHNDLFTRTKKDIAGKIRTRQVGIAGSKFTTPFPAEVYPLLREFFKWYERNKNKINPVELAALVHLKLVTIHSFSDGNGRISRIVMNFILNNHNYPMFDIPYKGRNSYYTALERSQTKKIDFIFLNWFIKKYIKENKKYLL